MELLENLKKRYATKKFDASQKVSEQNIDYIKPAEIPKETIEDLPQIALISSFRKHTA